MFVALSTKSLVNVSPCQHPCPGKELGRDDKTSLELLTCSSSTVPAMAPD